MIRGTTVPITATCADADFSIADAGTLTVTLEQGLTEVNVTPTVIDAHTLSISLTQTQSLSFAKNTYVSPIYIQANWLVSGVRYATNHSVLPFELQLYDEVIQ